MADLNPAMIEPMDWGSGPGKMYRRPYFAPQPGFGPDLIVEAIRGVWATSRLPLLKLNPHNLRKSQIINKPSHNTKGVPV